MTMKELLLQELEGTTDLLLGEVLEYLRYLKFRHGENADDLHDVRVSLSEAKEEGTAALTAAKSETALMSEPALAKDWLRAEEEEAWSHLQSVQ